jgi:hypothetical protein
MTPDEDFLRMMLDYFSIAQERHYEIMTQGSEILAKINAAMTTVDAMKAKFDAAMVGIRQNIPAGHAAVLDSLAAPLDELVAKFTAFEAEMEAAIKAIPVPGVVDPNAPAPEPDTNTAA